MQATTFGLCASKSPQGDCTPLHVAALEGHARCLSILLDAGADMESRDQDGKTALLVAAEHGRWGSVELLLHRGAVVDAQSTVRSRADSSALGSQL